MTYNYAKPHSLSPTGAPAPWTGLRVAVLVPCYNEALTIAKVVRDFRLCLPKADIYVYDNGSTDETAARAHEVGAIVRCEALQGKRQCDSADVCRCRGRRVRPGGRR